MSNFSAAILAADMQAANDWLNNTEQDPTRKSFGPKNFSVPAFAGPTPTYALLHSWGDPVFEAAVTSIPGVIIQQGIPIPPPEPGPVTSYNEDPIAMTSAAAATAGCEWGNDAKPLEGVVTPGLYRDDLNVLWWVIQTYDTAIYPDPAVIPALIRLAKIPGEALPWVQPLDQYDAYKLVNPFTGAGDRCTHNGDTWYVTQADGAGNNVWEPGVYGWTVEGETPLDYITYNADPVFYNGQGVTNG